MTDDNFDDLNNTPRCHPERERGTWAGGGREIAASLLHPHAQAPRSRSGSPASRPRADRTLLRLVPSCRAVLPPEVNELQVPLSPLLRRPQLLQILLRLRDVLAARQPPPCREPMNVRVDREGRLAERLRHHHARRLV